MAPSIEPIAENYLPYCRDDLGGEMLEVAIVAIRTVSVLTFFGGISVLAFETARNKPFGNAQLRKLRKYLANEPIHSHK